MGRPKSSPDQQIRAWNLREQRGYGPAAILKTLETEFDSPVSERTVKNWIHEFKVLSDEKAEDLDSPFEWHRVEEYGLPWKSGAFLLEVWKQLTRSRQEPSTQMPTVRQARWWWRVHLAVPEVIDPMDVFYLAERFVFRELLIDVLGQPNNMRDLEAHLAYKPWVDERNRLEYHTDIKFKGFIPPLQKTSELLEHLNTGSESELRKEVEKATLHGKDFIGPDLLYSQWLKNKIQEGAFVTRRDQLVDVEKEDEL